MEQTNALEKHSPCAVAQTYNPTLERLRQEDLEVKAMLYYIARPWLNKT